MPSLLIGLLLLAPPVADPVVARVNARVVTRSALDREVAQSGQPSVRAALRRLLGRALLLQEADLSGLGKGLPLSPPEKRAQAFLERVISRRSVCANLTETEVRQMYQAMRPRFVHGDLYEVVELRLPCPPGGDPADASCRHLAADYADAHWRAVASEMRGDADVAWLGLLSRTAPPTEVREYLFHVDAQGRATAPAEIAEAVSHLRPGEAAITSGDSGARLDVLVEHRPPISRQLDDPGVRDEVKGELCPRMVETHREQYVTDLLGSADVEIVRAALPPGADLPEGQRP